MAVDKDQSVMQPKGGDELKFWLKHVRALKDYPNKYGPTQFKSNAKLASRRADNVPPADRMAYEEVKSLDEVSKETLGSYITKAAANGFFAASDMSHHDIKGNHADAMAAHKKMSKRHSGIRKAVARLTKESMDLSEGDVHTKRADKEPVIVHAIDPKTGQSAARTIMRRAGEIKIGKKTRDEKAEALDEVSKDTLTRYVNSAVYNKGIQDRHFGRTLDRESMAKSGKRLKGITTAIAKLSTSGHARVQATEAFEPGSLKLQDGSLVSVTNEDASALNALFKQLNADNKAKMESRVMSSKAGFNEILAFAENI